MKGENMSLTQLQETVLICDNVGSYKRYQSHTQIQH